MLQGIVDGISKKLSAVFGEGYKIYPEHVSQGMKEPCFFIQLVSQSSRRVMDRRFFREHQFCIRYYPKSRDEPRAECFAAQDALFPALSYITADGDLLRGTGMHGEFVDGVLNFFVDFNLFVLTPVEQTPMEELALTEITTKG
jgi:hypothetical protein